jgi:hypothetical protein
MLAQKKMQLSVYFSHSQACGNCSAITQKTIATILYHPLKDLYDNDFVAIFSRGNC